MPRLGKKMIQASTYGVCYSCGHKCWLLCWRTQRGQMERKATPPLLPTKPADSRQPVMKRHTYLWQHVTGHESMAPGVTQLLWAPSVVHRIQEPQGLPVWASRAFPTRLEVVLFKLGTSSSSVLKDWFWCLRFFFSRITTWLMVSVLILLRGTCFLEKAEHMLLCKLLSGALQPLSQHYGLWLGLYLWVIPRPVSQQSNMLCVPTTLQRCGRTSVAQAARAAIQAEDNMEQQGQAQQLCPAREGSGSSCFGTELKPQWKLQG